MQEIPKSIRKRMSEHKLEAYLFVLEQYGRPLYYYLSQKGYTDEETADLLVQLIQNLKTAVSLSATAVWTAEQLEEWIYRELAHLSGPNINLTVDSEGTVTGSADNLEKDAANRVEIDLLNSLYKGIEALPEPHKTIFKLRYLEELPFRDVAKQTALPEPTVKVLYAKAFVLLKNDTLGKEGMDNPIT